MADQTPGEAPKDRDPDADRENAWHGRDRYAPSSPGAGRPRDAADPAVFAAQAVIAARRQGA